MFFITVRVYNLSDCHAKIKCQCFFFKLMIKVITILDRNNSCLAIIKIVLRTWPWTLNSIMIFYVALCKLSKRKVARLYIELCYNISQNIWQWTNMSNSIETSEYRLKLSWHLWTIADFTELLSFPYLRKQFVLKLWQTTTLSSET